MMTRRAASLALPALAAGTALRSFADDYPSRPIRILVPFTSGSGSDATARHFAGKMAPLIGGPLLVENKTGANGAICMIAAKAASADGYTIVQGGISPTVVNAVVRPDLGYDPFDDFVPLTGYGRNMNVLVVANESRLRSFADVLTAGRDSRLGLNMGTFSTALALTGAWLAKLARTRFNNIAYKGQGPVMTDVIGNQLDFGLVDLGGASLLIRSGKLRALGVTGDRRHADFPDIPAVRETAGLREFSQSSWNAFYVRAGTPPAIRARLGRAIRSVMTSKETVREFYAPKGTEGIPLDPVSMQALQRQEIARFKRIAAEVGAIPKR